ncbi:hypothetical protein [Candidatus Magnetominusculus dajiuhuensis]|uniref:hypothetical protein n=1 Tax=Candidatus Magnetominusculus dajiuhuensis TaxID=3137712 RepID=UPI003B439FE6
MKTIAITMIRPVLIVALLVLAAPAAFAEGDYTPAFQSGSVNGIDYITGGVGLDERESLDAIARDRYNVKLVFAMTNRDYVSDVFVEITNKSGKRIFEATSDGPICYLKLPAGSYSIRASYEGVVRSQSITAGATSRNVDFRWQ